MALGSQVKKIGTKWLTELNECIHQVIPALSLAKSLTMTESIILSFCLPKSFHTFVSLFSMTMKVLTTYSFDPTLHYDFIRLQFIRVLFLMKRHKKKYNYKLQTKLSDIFEYTW